MDKSIITQIQQGINTAFIDQRISSNLAFKPEFISNNYREGTKVLSSIEEELSSCDEFIISVAFITKSGITPLLGILKELKQRGIKGKILTTDYLTFTQPEALDKLASLDNIELRMYRSKSDVDGFHTKGYIFKKSESYKIIIGSSNMTQKALTVNREWNTKLVALETGEYTQNLLDEFYRLWDSKNAENYNEFIENYRTEYEIIKKQKKIAKEAQVASIEQYRLQPNKMQTRFINNLKKIQEKSEKRALLISATGTGKTYAAAFALREANPSKALFLVHREQIAKQAKRSFENVFGSTKKMGLLSGNSKDYEADYLFSTMQMMAREDVMEKFAPDEFDYIVIDEVHRAGAGSYQRIIDYFQPKFLLGMTASPERTDSYDIFALFQHNIAYEIRLQQALEEDLLCPFHYFGITDMEIDGEAFDDETGLNHFANLVCDQRVNYILEQINYYGYSGNRVKGLIFCSRKEEAQELSVKFNERGYRTAVLTGEDSQAKREQYIERLTMDGQDYLDYIFTIDIFNEGVDIPEINQVIMLRPTQSPIVFVQQLGRGLRKADDKEYVVILDFIGNYTNNFMIPIALSGDRTYNKDNIRKYVREGSRVIPGSSSIHFDEISRKRIYESIDKANFSQVKLIRENYTNLKNKLGKIPSLMDFDLHGEMDVLCIFDNKSLGSYYKFLVKYEKEYTIRLSEDEEKVVEYISRKFASGKRIHELELLRRTLFYKDRLMQGLEKDLKENYEISLDKNAIENIVNIMTNQFPTGSGKKTYEKCVFLKPKDDDFEVSENFANMLENEDFYYIVEELISFGISRYMKNYSHTYQDTNLVLYQKYTYEDACRLLNWENNEVPLNIGGYKFDKKTKTFPVFINYEKNADISDTINYEDHFVSSNRLIAISKSGRSQESDDVQNFLHAKERGIAVHLFVRKNKDDNISKEFYYLGKMSATGEIKEFVMQNTEKTAVEIEWVLDRPVREDIYDYITGE